MGLSLSWGKTAAVPFYLISQDQLSEDP